MNNSVWHIMHPEFLPAGSDLYYEKLCTRIKNTLDKIEIFEKLTNSGLISDFVAKMTTGYLEDKASGFGVWDAFVSLCEERYGHKLPFYEVGAEYDTESINFEDAKFLVWLAISMSGVKDELMYSPVGLLIDTVARLVYEFLSEEWLDAPESTRITRYIDKCLSSTNWFDQRKLAEWLTFNCYLTSVPDLYGDIVESKSPKKEVDDNQYVYAQRAIASVSCHLRPLGLRSNDYLRMMARNKGYEEVVKLWESFKFAGMAVYKIIGEDKDTVDVETVNRQSHSAPFIGVTKKLLLASLAATKGMKVGKYLGGSFVEWNGIWELNGMLTIFPESPSSFEGGKEFLQATPEVVEEFENKARLLIEKNGDSRIAFFSSFGEMYEFFGLPAEVLPKKHPEVSTDNGLTCYIGDLGTNLISLKVGSCLKSPANPFYNEKVASTPGMIVHFFFGPDCLPYDMSVYAADRGMLADANLSGPQNPEEGKRIVQDNLRYWIDFYHSDLFSTLGS